MPMSLFGTPESQPSQRMGFCQVSLAAAGILLFATLSAAAQNPITTAPSTPPRSPSLLSPAANRPPDANDQMLMREARIRKTNFDAVNAERLRQITQASQIMQTLAMALEAEIEKDKTGGVSKSEVQKAETIEKLARAVVDRMKLTIAPN